MYTSFASFWPLFLGLMRKEPGRAGGGEGGWRVFQPSTLSHKKTSCYRSQSWNNNKIDGSAGATQGTAYEVSTLPHKGTSCYKNQCKSVPRQLCNRREARPPPKPTLQKFHRQIRGSEWVSESVSELVSWLVGEWVSELVSWLVS